MPLFVFSTTKPAANNDPGLDQPDMLQNNVSTNAIINVNHFPFNDADGALHKQTQIKDQATIPSGLILGNSTIYSKNVQVDDGPINNSTLFCTAGNVGKEYQLTRMIDSEFPTFGTRTVYDAGKPDQSGGWTFLPGQQNASGTAGGLLLQYGFVANASNGTVVDFPVQFTQQFSITVTHIPGSDPAASWGIRASSNSSFTFKLSGSTGIGIYWMAIGA